MSDKKIYKKIYNVMNLLFGIAWIVLFLFWFYIIGDAALRLLSLCR